MITPDVFSHKPGEVRHVTSTSNEIVKALRSLHLKKHRDETGLFLAEGGRTLIEAFELGHRPHALICLAGAPLDDTQQAMRDEVIGTGGLILDVSAAVLDKISARDNPQTLIGLFAQIWTPLDELSHATAQIMALEQVRDPGNLGTIIRSCDGFGVKHLVLIGDTTDPYGLEAVRASMGSVFAVKLVRASLAEFSDWLSRFPGAVAGTSLIGATDISSYDFATPHVIVMGNEQKGLTPALKAKCTHLIKIPMHGRADSFNLAVATGITLYCAALKLRG